MTGLIKEFQKLWAETSEEILLGLRRVETGPRSPLCAFLQRAVSGGAMVIPECASGRGRVYIVVQCQGRDYPVGLKLKDNDKGFAASQRQLLAYMDRLLADEGWLVVFDLELRRAGKKKSAGRRWLQLRARARRFTWSAAEALSGLEAAGRDAPFGSQSALFWERLFGRKNHPGAVSRKEPALSLFSRPTAKSQDRGLREEPRVNGARGRSWPGRFEVAGGRGGARKTGGSLNSLRM